MSSVSIPTPSSSSTYQIGKVLLNGSKLAYATCLATSPFWGSGVLLATAMMNDSGHFRERFQLGCFLSLVASPITLIYTLNRMLNSNNKPVGLLVSILPLIPVISYITCLNLFFNDKKQPKKGDE